MRSAGGHLRTYLQLENEQTPWISPAVSTPHRGLSREVSCLSRQNELDGHRPTDVTGSPRSAQKSLSPGSGRDCSLPNKLAAMLFFAIAPLCLRGTVPVQTGSPRAFEWHKREKPRPALWPVGLSSRRVQLRWGLPCLLWRAGLAGAQAQELSFCTHEQSAGSAFHAICSRHPAFDGTDEHST